MSSTIIFSQPSLLSDFRSIASIFHTVFLSTRYNHKTLQVCSWKAEFEGGLLTAAHNKEPSLKHIATCSTAGIYRQTSRFLADPYASIPGFVWFRSLIMILHSCLSNFVQLLRECCHKASSI